MDKHKDKWRQQKYNQRRWNIIFDPFASKMEVRFIERKNKNRKKSEKISPLYSDHMLIAHRCPRQIQSKKYEKKLCQEYTQ